MTLERQSLTIGLAISIMLTVVFDQNTVLARGGGGGFRGGGGFNRGDFNRGGFEGGFDRNDSDSRDMHGFLNSGYEHPESSEQHSQSPAEDRTYNWSSGQHGLSTDNGLNKTASAMTPGESARVTPAQLAERGDMVRNAYRYPGVFNSGWWRAHPNAWRYGAWGNDWAWGATGWPAIAGWWGMPVDVAPVPYDYGNNITYQNDTVYYGSQPMGSSVAYYQEAQTLAESPPILSGKKNQSSATDWKPLGVYSLVQGEQSNTNMMFQLAVNKDGIIKGNYYNALTDETKPVSGAVDKKNMRAAWIIGDNKNVVYDTGLSNLLKEQSPILVHLGKDKTEQWTLVKLQQPQKG